MEAKDSVTQRIMEICQELYCGNKSKMARGTGIENSYIRSISAGRCTSIGSEKLQLIVKNTTPTISPVWLLTGEGKMLREEKPQEEVSVPDYRDKYIAVLEENKVLIAENNLLKKQLEVVRSRNVSIADTSMNPQKTSLAG
jgi:hypothetical protein